MLLLFLWINYGSWWWWTNVSSLIHAETEVWTQAMVLWSILALGWEVTSWLPGNHMRTSKMTNADPEMMLHKVSCCSFFRCVTVCVCVSYSHHRFKVKQQPENAGLSPHFHLCHLHIVVSTLQFSCLEVKVISLVFRIFIMLVFQTACFCCVVHQWLHTLRQSEIMH